MFNRNNIPIVYFVVMSLVSLLATLIFGLFLGAPYLGSLMFTFTIVSTFIWYGVLAIINKSGNKSKSTPSVLGSAISDDDW